MFQYICPANVLAAVWRLKSNNPLYKDIKINSNWLSDVFKMMLICGKHCQHRIVHLHHSHYDQIRLIITLVVVSYTDEAILNSPARERGFGVQYVPRDGNCLFSAVAMQLENVGIQLGERNLREELIKHVATYFQFPWYIGHDPFNADTEAHSEQDEL